MQRNTESLSQYIRLVERLFSNWKIGAEDKLILLGFEATGKDLAHVLEHFLLQENSRDLTERIAYLFAIHANLRIIFPRNKNMVYGWMTAQCADFYSKTPIEVVKEHGLVGLNMLNKYLEKEKNM